MFREPVEFFGIRIGSSNPADFYDDWTSREIIDSRDNFIPLPKYEKVFPAGQLNVIGEGRLIEVVDEQDNILYRKIGKRFYKGFDRMINVHIMGIYVGTAFDHDYDGADLVYYRFKPSPEFDEMGEGDLYVEPERGLVSMVDPETDVITYTRQGKNFLNLLMQ